MCTPSRVEPSSLPPYKAPPGPDPLRTLFLPPTSPASHSSNSCPRRRCVVGGWVERGGAHVGPMSGSSASSSPATISGAAEYLSTQHTNTGWDLIAKPL